MYDLIYSDTSFCLLAEHSIRIQNSVARGSQLYTLCLSAFVFLFFFVFLFLLQQNIEVIFSFDWGVATHSVVYLLYSMFYILSVVASILLCVFKRCILYFAFNDNIKHRAVHQNAEGSCLGPEASETQFWGTMYMPKHKFWGTCRNTMIN